LKLNLDINTVERGMLGSLLYGVVQTGKQSPKLKALAKERGLSGAKYDDVSNMGETGAISIQDAYLLYWMVKTFKPKKILEIGTWFGTSAAVMREGCQDTEVFTCDKNNVFVCEKMDRIHYHNMGSTPFLKKMRADGHKFDMVFMDGRFYPKDERRVLKLMRRPIYATHDYEEGQKGWRNIHALRPIFPEHRMFVNGIIASLIGADEMERVNEQA